MLSGCNTENSGNIVLLTYHGIQETIDSDEPWQQIRLAEDFEDDMRKIKQSDLEAKNYSYVIKKFKKGESVTEPTIIIQFDDGLSSAYEFVYPTLSELNLKASFFITPGRADRPVEGYMSWDQIKEIYNYENKNGESLFEIGGHGQTHTKLSLKEDEQHEQWVEQYELGKPQEEIEKHLGIKTKLFTLPFGAGFGEEKVISVSVSLNYELVRGWKKDDNNFLHFQPNNVVFIPFYNNSEINNVIKKAKGE